MSNTLFAIYGASGFGREIMPIARKIISQNSSPDRLVFIDDGEASGIVNGHEVMSYTDFLAQPEASKKVSIAIANSEIREKISESLKYDGIESWDIIAENVEVLDEVDLGVGSLLCPFVTLTSNVKIGSYFHANIYSYVAHDCVIGNFVTFAPRVCCNGNVHIEDHAYIGTGAVLKQGTPGKPLIIGRGAVVGMGAVVTKNVPAGAVVVGNPAKALVKSTA